MIYLSLWLAGIAIGMSAVYGLYGGFQGRVLTGAENIFFNMLTRTGWGVLLLLYCLPVTMVTVVPLTPSCLCVLDSPQSTNVHGLPGTPDSTVCCTSQ